MPKFFHFKPTDLLEKFKTKSEYLPSYQDIYVNINLINSVTKITNDLYKLMIGERTWYIKKEVFERLKNEVLDAK